MATLIDLTMPCADPRPLLDYCHLATPPLPTDWWDDPTKRPNHFAIPLGRTPGSGFVLLRDQDLSDLDQTIDHTLTFRDAEGNERTLQKITFLKSRCITPGGAENDNSHFVCELVDRRWFLSRIPVDKAYNVSAADGLSYLASSLNAGFAWTWQQLVQDLCTTLGLGTQTLPFTPDSTPNNLIFWASFAWPALNDVLDRIACTVRYDPEADTFSIIRLGATTAAGAVAAQNLGNTLAAQQVQVWNSFWNEPARGRLPEKIRVVFSRRPQPTDGTSIYYTVDVTLAATAGVKAGTYEQLHDDLTAVGLGVPTNAALLATRAAERAADWLRKRLYNENRLTIVYRDYQDGPALLAETAGGVAYDDRGDVMATEITSGPDGAMERFRAYEQPFTQDPDASTTVRGYVNTTTQEFAGDKTFAGTVELAQNGGASPNFQYGPIWFGPSASPFSASLTGVGDVNTGVNVRLIFLTHANLDIQCATLAINSILGMTTNVTISGTTLHFTNGILTSVT